MALILRWALRSNLDCPCQVWWESPAIMETRQTSQRQVRLTRSAQPFVAGSQAWLAANPNKQARANFAEIEKASAESLKEAHAFSAHCSKYRSPGADPDRRIQDASDHRLAATLSELEERLVILLQTVEDWGQ